MDRIIERRRSHVYEADEGIRVRAYCKEVSGVFKRCVSFFFSSRRRHTRLVVKHLSL
mgnify:CR=1 FL=1